MLKDYAFCGTLELSTEVTQQLRLNFEDFCDVFSIAS